VLSGELVPAVRELKQRNSGPILMYRIDAIGEAVVAVRPAGRVHLVGVAAHQHRVRRIELFEGDLGGLVVDVLEVPAIHVVDHAVEADEGGTDDRLHRDAPIGDEVTW
jgi:threonine dehydrogenase-like Zn-dependent dehydrogenase